MIAADSCLRPSHLDRCAVLLSVVEVPEVAQLVTRTIFPNLPPLTKLS
jgi:hypothetical protein